MTWLIFGAPGANLARISSAIPATLRLRLQTNPNGIIMCLQGLPLQLSFPHPFQSRVSRNGTAPSSGGWPQSCGACLTAIPLEPACMPRRRSPSGTWQALVGSGASRLDDTKRKQQAFDLRMVEPLVAKSAWDLAAVVLDHCHCHCFRCCFR